MDTKERKTANDTRTTGPAPVPDPLGIRHTALAAKNDLENEATTSRGESENFLTPPRARHGGSGRRGEGQPAESGLGLSAQPQETDPIRFRQIGGVEQPVAMGDDALLAVDDEGERGARQDAARDISIAHGHGRARDLDGEGEPGIRAGLARCRQKSIAGAGAASAFFGLSATSASVVISSEATEAASCKAVRTTLAGSITPALTMSWYSPVAALKPQL